MLTGTPDQQARAARKRYLVEVIGPLVEQLRACYVLTQNPEVHAQMTHAVNLYEAEMITLDGSP